GKEVDVRGMLLLGGAVLFLTMALIEANPFGGDLPLWLSLMQGAILLGVLFFWWERRAPDPMITPGLLANKQFRNANIAMLFFAAGAIGSLLLLSLVFVNLWGYTELEAGFAILPIPLCGLLAWPFVGKAADTRPPGELAKPALLLLGVGMLWVSFLPSTADDAWAYIRILPGLLMIGAGMGIGFPSLNVGAMGAGTGQELGLASGVLNTARQLGAAIGVAILIATFGGALHAHMSWFADDEIEDIVDDYDMPKPMAAQVIGSTLHDYTGGSEHRFVPKPGFEQDIVRDTTEFAREGFAWAFRQAAILVLSALPLMGALRRTPAQARAEAMAAAAGQGPPPADGAGTADGRDGAEGRSTKGDGDGAPRGSPTPGAEPHPA